MQDETPNKVENFILIYSNFASFIISFNFWNKNRDPDLNFAGQKNENPPKNEKPFTRDDHQFYDLRVEQIFILFIVKLPFGTITFWVENVSGFRFIFGIEETGCYSRNFISYFFTVVRCQLTQNVAVPEEWLIRIQNILSDWKTHSNCKSYRVFKSSGGAKSQFRWRNGSFYSQK